MDALQQPPAKKYTRVGTGVFLLRKGQIYLQRRKGSHGEGEWSLPGGKNDFMEPAIVGAARETREETGIDITEDDLEFLTYSDDAWPEIPIHYITLYYVAKDFRGDPKIMEPNKCTESKWFPFGKSKYASFNEIMSCLPSPRFNGTDKILRSHFRKIRMIARNYGIW